MKKLFVFLICFLLTCNYICAYTLKAGISYTVEIARQEAFDKTPEKIDMVVYSFALHDKNYDKNMLLLKKNKKKFEDRYINKFSDGTYALTYIDNRCISYYYDNKGCLYGIDISDNISYPRKALKYDANGNLEGVSLDLSNYEQFIFDNNKKLVAHWIGKNCYNENGELVKTRK